MGRSRKYRVTANPDLKSVSPGARIDYFCAQNWSTVSDPNAEQDKFQWEVHNDPDSRRQYGVPVIVKGPAKAAWPKAKWDVPGHHTVYCGVNFAAGFHQYFKYRQLVESTDAILYRDLAKARRNLPNPDEVLNSIGRYISILERMPVDAAAKSRHEKQLKSYKQYAAALEKRMKPVRGWFTTPMPAVHIVRTSQERSTLKILLAQKTVGMTDDLKLIDWTNPFDRTRTGEYSVHGQDERKLIHELISEWRSGNRYPPGTIAYRLPFTIGNSDRRSSFKSDGSSKWDTISDWLDWIALGGAVAAGIITLVAPVPGSRAVSFAIWTSIFSSSAAAVINISSRHAEGFGNLRDDAFDGLTLLGNIFAGGTMSLWKKGGTVLAKNAKGQTVKYFLVGQVGTDSVQGVMILHEHMQAYDQIVNDPSLTPDERSKKLLSLGGSAGLSAIMTYINVKASKVDIANLKKPPRHLKGDAALTGEQKLKQLADPNGKPLDTTQLTVVEGSTAGRKLKTTVREDIKRNAVDNAARAKPRGKGRKPVPRTKKLALGLEIRGTEVNYKTWAKEKDFATYSNSVFDGARSNGFGNEVIHAMKTADEIHFNLREVDVKRAGRRDALPNKGMDDYGNPMPTPGVDRSKGYFTDFELWQLSNNKEFADKVTWYQWVNGKEIELPKGWWPAGLKDPR